MSKYITTDTFTIIRSGKIVRFAADTVYEFSDNEAQALGTLLAEAPKKAEVSSATTVTSTPNNSVALMSLERLTKTAELVAEAAAAVANKAEPKEESLG